MPMTDVEIGRMLQSFDEMSKQLESIVKKLELWQPIIDTAHKQQVDSRSRNLTLTVALVASIGVWLVTMSVWYIQKGGPVPVNTAPISIVGGSNK